MGILSDLLNPTPARAQSLESLGFNRVILDGGFAVASPSKSGQVVTAESALSHSAVFACVKVLSEDIAKLPFWVYRRRADGGRERATSSALQRTLKRPNDWQSGFEWREMMMGHVLLRGNAYSEILRRRRTDTNGETEIQALIPRNPDRVQIFQMEDQGITRYQYTPPGGEPRDILPENMFHLRGLSSDGFSGISVVGAMRESVGLSMAAETHGSRVFQNAAQIPIAIKHPDELKEATFKRLKADFENLQGAEKAGSVMFLEEGMSVEKIGMTNEDSQFLETRKFQVPDIARFFRIPPHKIMDLERATFSNIEHQEIGYVVDSLQPWCGRWESTVDRVLIRQRETFFAEFALQALMRGDMATRSQFYASAVTTGWMNRNEVRDFENLNRVDGLDGYLQPLNMAEVGDDDDDEEPTPVEMVGADEPAQGDESASSEAETVGVPPQTGAIVRACCARLVSQETVQVAKYAPKYSRNQAGWAAWVVRFYSRHTKRIQESLFVDEATATAYCERQTQQLLTNGIHIAESWGDDQIQELYEMALGESKCYDAKT